MRNASRLTAVKVAKLTRPGRYADGDGLYLQVSKWHTKAWLFRYERAGRERQMGLGPVDLISLADARERARAARRVILDGGDPIDARVSLRAEKLVEAAKSITFKACAEAYIDAHSPGWRNAKHASQWGSTLEGYAYPVIGDLPASAVDTTLVLKVLEPIWTKKTETANRLRGRIEKILDWARVRGYRAGENPARWQGHLDEVLPRKSKVAPTKHHPALPYQQIPAFVVELRAIDGMAARALEFTMLTAARTGAVIGGTLSEIDFVAKVWTVPPERTGAKITGDDPSPRRVPLCDRAIQILKSIQRSEGNPFLFPGRQAGKPLSDMAMLTLLRGLRPGYVPHGFRSSFKDWCSETTAYPNEVSEAALWHVVEDKVEAAYRRGDLMDKRRLLMKDWERYCLQPIAEGGKVVRLRKRGSR